MQLEAPSISPFLGTTVLPAVLQGLETAASFISSSFPFCSDGVRAHATPLTPSGAEVEGFFHLVFIYLCKHFTHGHGPRFIYLCTRENTSYRELQTINFQEMTAD